MKKVANHYHSVITRLILKQPVSVSEAFGLFATLLLFSLIMVMLFGSEGFSQSK